MATISVKRFSKCDERRMFAGHGEADLVTLGGTTLGLGIFEPGWKWSQDVKPIAGTKSCEAEHFGYVLSGRMLVKLDDGTELELRPGDVVSIPPGHDAWVLGDEPCKMLDFKMGDYARPTVAAAESRRPEVRH